MPWRKMLAYITGTVDQELLLRNEHLAVPARPTELDNQPERSTAEKRLGGLLNFYYGRAA